MAVRAAAAVMLLMLASCSNAQPADLESLGLAVDVDVQAGERLDLTVGKDPAISVTDVSTPSGVTATVSQPDDETLSLSVEVDPETPAGSYTLLLRTDRSGEGAELEWPFDVVESEEQPDLPEPAAPTADDVRNEFVAALAAKDAVALQALWPTSSWDTLGVDVLDTFVPVQPDTPCQAFDEGRSNCFVFEQNNPFVLGLTMAFSTADGWTIESVSLDSTN